MSSWVVGVDLGGTKIELGLLSPDNEIVARRRIATEVGAGPEAAVERMALSVAELVKSLPGDRQIAALGICSPGPIDHVGGMLLDPPNLQTFHHTPLSRMIEDRLGIPVALEHDAKAAALGEYHFGAGRGERSMVYIVIGTGVGCALIVDGEIYRGLRNSAGECGHTTLDREGERCSCGSRGCVETYMSGPWLARRYKRALAASNRPAGEVITGQTVTRQAAKGDPLASQIMNDAGIALGTIVATMAMILDIELYVIGGSVSKAGDLLLQPAREIVPCYSFGTVGSRVRIVASALGEDAPLLGCAWLARQL